MLATLSKFIKLNDINVVGVIKKEDCEVYNLLSIKKKANKITIVSKQTFENFEILAKTTDKKIPLIIVIEGKGVLNKEINFENEADVNWQKNIDYNTIYYTDIKGANSNFISFCRKNIVEETLSKFQKKGFQVIDVYIGSFLAALLNNTLKKEILFSTDLSLEFENDKLLRFTKQNETVKTVAYKIGEDSVSSTFLPLYGTIIHFFVQPDGVSKTTNETLNSEELIYKKAFHYLGVIMLVGFLFSLLVSYFLIQYYGTKNAELNLQTVYSNQSYQLILDLEAQKEKKLNILKESGVLSSKFLSYYGYQLIKSVPYDISLNELNIIPLSGEYKENKKVFFENKTILIKGETFQESSFNNWLEDIKKMDWLQRFEIISLKKDKKNKSIFEIKITLKNV
ncbi:hypothetical protein SGQ83_18295 [Flavobacterium sp. Fl-318]|uniref:General secretion pathway protein n=1 Tax=Flavobacterium cupriresistens TaxID=2893885 RepID=A0ABU4RLC4_9FLAO|nr:MULTISPECIES: hypothetical protein [unclassified Flavobacterium]MDX6191311.1 hypothetical protein [Flavobacterium sp. Fl-318]UFH42371.1 hypothetical protein LNP23_21510 [Flavobacterium sp. F-323]